MISNTTLQAAYKGATGVTRMMLGPDLVWPKAPTLLLGIAAGARSFNLDFRTPAPFLIFQEVGGPAYLFSAVKNTTNRTLRTEARSTEGYYSADHITPNSSKVSYDISIKANFQGSLSVQLHTVGSKVSRLNRYAAYSDRSNGYISISTKNDYSIDVSFQIEISNSAGTTLVNTVLVIPGNSIQGTNRGGGTKLLTGIPAGNYTVKLLNLINNIEYEQIVIVKSITGNSTGNRYTVVAGALEGALLTDDFKAKEIMVYPTTRDKAYKTFYGDVAVIEILAYNMTGSAYSASAGADGWDRYSQSGSCLILAKLLAGGSGYRANAFYPIFWEEIRTGPARGGNADARQLPSRTYADLLAYQVPFETSPEQPLKDIVPVFVALTNSNGSVYSIVEYDEQQYGYRLENDRSSGAGMHWLHFHSTYGRSHDMAYSNYGENFAYSSTDILVPYAPQYVLYLDPVTGSHVTDSTWVNINIKNDAGQISPVTKTLIDPFSDTGGADVVAILGNVGNGNFSPFFANAAEYTDAPITLHTLDPEEEWFSMPNNTSFGGYWIGQTSYNSQYNYSGYWNNLYQHPRWSVGTNNNGLPIGNYGLSADANGLPVVMRTGSSTFLTDGTGDVIRGFSSNVNFGSQPYYNLYRTLYDTADFINGVAPWRESLGIDGVGVGSPVYTAVNFRANQATRMNQIRPDMLELDTNNRTSTFVYGQQEAVLTYDEVPFRAQHNGNFSKKSIEFVNYTGKGGPFGQPEGFIPNTLEGDPEVEPVNIVNFNDTAISGVTAIAQAPLKLLRGSDFTQTVNASTGTIDNKLNFTPNSLESVYSEDIAFTDVNEYCVLEVGAAIPYGCMDGLASKLSKHPGDNEPCLSVAGTGSSNFSLYTFYIRLKAKGTGYPPNSKIPVYIRRGKDHLPHYDQSLLPANPGPILDIGQVSNITVDGRGSGGPCVCMIHTDDSGVTTHITEYVDPKSKCKADSIFTADVNDGVNYDGSESPPMAHPDGGGEWYNERPSQYRRLMNLGEVSNSLYGYAKDYIAPIDLVDDTDSGKAKWNSSSGFGADSSLYVSKAANFGTIARYKNASAFEKDNQLIYATRAPAISGRFPYMYAYDTPAMNNAPFAPTYVGDPLAGSWQIILYIPADIKLGPLLWHQRISKNNAFQVNEFPSAWLSTSINSPIKNLWQSFITWQAYRDVYKIKGIAYNNVSGQLRGQLTADANNYDAPAETRYDGNYVTNRPAHMNYYYRPGTDQNFKDENLLFDRHGLTNEGFPGQKLPYQTPEMGPDYIVCRIATPNVAPTSDYSSTGAGLQGQAITSIGSMEDTAPPGSPYGSTIRNDSRGDSFHCWHVLGHRNWVSLGDVTTENGGRKIIVHDAFVNNSSDITIQPGVYPS
tara:strand:- start:2990 stop:7123 length:4134 start_codon:yes stop_codon:yes gene_type:complete